MEMKLPEELTFSVPSPIRSGTRGNRVITSHSSTPTFANVLKNHQQNMAVKLSGHAQERLKQQNIIISPQDISRISDAAQMAEMKGSRESLILLRDLALVVNISNRTIITAVNKTRQKEKIFTNIDSTVIL